LIKVVEMPREMASEETRVEFGSKMGGETLMIIAKGAAEVNFKRWPSLVRAVSSFVVEPQRRERELV
jgi:hypothetical protein